MGVPAALLVSNLQLTVEALAAALTEPNERCRWVHRVPCRNIAPGRFAFLFYGLPDGRATRLLHTCGGHTLPILVRDDGNVTHSR